MGGGDTECAGQPEATLVVRRNTGRRIAGGPAGATVTGAVVTQPTYDRNFWEERWSQVLREHADQVAHHPPSAHLMAEVENLRPGLALDAGCGHGSDTRWLATRGWMQR